MSLLISILFSLNTFAIQNGRSPEPEERKALSGFVSLTFDPFSIASATYIGKGRFLTAAHNLLGLEEKGKNAKFAVISDDNILLSDIPASEYTIHLPPSKTSKEFVTSTGKNVLIPLPDVMIVEVAQKHIASLKSLKPISIQRYTPKLNERVAVMGVGATTFSGLTGYGTTQIGFVNIADFEGVSIARSYWVDGDDSSATRFGDSGGPLLQYDPQQKKFFIFGVTVSVLQGTKNGKNASMSKFQLLADPVVSKWLEGFSL